MSKLWVLSTTCRWSAWLTISPLRPRSFKTTLPRVTSLSSENCSLTGTSCGEVGRFCMLKITCYILLVTPPLGFVQFLLCHSRGHQACKQRDAVADAMMNTKRIKSIVHLCYELDVRDMLLTQMHNRFDPFGVHHSISNSACTQLKQHATTQFLATHINDVTTFIAGQIASNQNASRCLLKRLLLTSTVSVPVPVFPKFVVLCCTVFSPGFPARRFYPGPQQALNSPWPCNVKCSLFCTSSCSLLLVPSPASFRLLPTLRNVQHNLFYTSLCSLSFVPSPIIGRSASIGCSLREPAVIIILIQRHLNQDGKQPCARTPG